MIILVEAHSTTKYVIKARFEVDGVVEKPDVVGAIFGQTEGLFGPDLDLRELQKTGRIGRIEIDISSERDKTHGTIIIPSSLDKTSTAIIAAAVESVDRIGPCSAKVTLEKIEDLREKKRQLILDKAKEILKNWVVEGSPSTDEILREVSEVIKSTQITSLGPEKLPAGPEALEAGSIIIVEGRADVLNLLRCGIRNAVGINGTKIPKTIIELSKDKETTAFLDGDRGGDLILKELLQVADIDYVARAPPGKEVEELTPKEVMHCLRERLPTNKVKIERKPEGLPLPDSIIKAARDLRGTLEAILFTEKGDEIAKIPVGELAVKLKDLEGDVDVILFDGVITQRILDLAEEKGVKLVIGDRISNAAHIPATVRIARISEVVHDVQSEADS
ncbi:MAG: DNA primase DnaG [Candidatus Bathyarchaeia archaeon]|nr:DNA primase [Candidatus Bathyarchaeota archaeon]